MSNRQSLKVSIIHNHKLYTHDVFDTANVGRESLLNKKCEITINDKFFPNSAGKFFLQNDQWYFGNLQNNYSCYVNKQPLEMNNGIILRNNDVIAYVPKGNGSAANIVVMIVCINDTAIYEWSEFPFNGGIASSLDANNFYMQGNDLYISCRSGRTIVNQRLINQDHEAHILDFVVIDNRAYMILNDAVIVRSGSTQAVSKKADGVLSVDIRSRKAGAKELLKNIRLKINPGEMVLIMGGSGAGKTTLVNAIKGDEQAQDATIIYDNYNVYDKGQYQIIQNKIGYVPQKDTMPTGDTVYRTIEDAAKMSVLEDMRNPYLLREHVNKALETFSLQNEAGKLVSKLSGGETKRLSTAKAYVKQPSLFFLDEPDSGLDENSKNQLLSILSKISHQENKTVIVISHNSLDYGPKYESEPNYVSHYDKVIVLAKDSNNTGRLAFFGSPHDACVFFKVSCLKEIINRIEPPEKHGEGLADYFVEEFNNIRKD